MGYMKGISVRFMQMWLQARIKKGGVYFIYEKGSKNCAKFTISGTTLDNELGFNGVEES